MTADTPLTFAGQVAASTCDYAGGGQFVDQYNQTLLSEVLLSANDNVVELDLKSITLLNMKFGGGM